MKNISLLVLSLFCLSAQAAIAATTQPATTSAPAASQVSAKEAIALLQKAEKLCQSAKQKKIDLSNMDMVMGLISYDYAALGKVDKAEMAAKSIGDKKCRQSCIEMIPIALVWKGYVDKAVSLTKDTNNPYLFSQVVALCANHDLEKALSLSHKVKEQYRSYVYAASLNSRF